MGCAGEKVGSGNWSFLIVLREIRKWVQLETTIVCFLRKELRICHTHICKIGRAHV